MNSSDWPRSPRSAALMTAAAAAFTTSLVLGTDFLVLSDRATDAVTVAGPTLTDDQPAAYQAAVYMTIRLPQGNSVYYLRQIATAMRGNRWTDAPSKGEHFGQKLTKAGVTSIFYRNVTDQLD